MNCDQVFDVLTRGPFPTGERSDADVERHLAVCPECRRLAEALRPALELFQEAVSVEESRDLPGYWGEELETAPASSSGGTLAQLAAAARPLRRATSGRLRALAADWQAWRLAGALLVGFTLGMALVASVTSALRDDTPEEQPWVAMRAPDAPPPSTFAALSRFHLAPACLTVFAAEPDGGIATDPGTGSELEQLKCCTQCHGHGRSIALPPPATALLAQSCAECHK